MSRILAIPCLLLLSVLANSAYAYALVGPGHVIHAGDVICSPNPGGVAGCDYTLAMQTDGNLVMYSGSGSAIWASNTSGSGATYATMQTDGNLVVYTPSGTAAWASNTHSNNGAYLAIQDDGSLNIYVTASTWATNTTNGLTGPSTHLAPGTRLLPPQQFVFSPNGENVLAISSGALYLQDISVIVWYAPISNTQTIAYAEMQTDGNFVVYNGLGQSIWATNTANKPGSFLSLQNDGNLVVYSPGALWTRQSGTQSPPNGAVPSIDVATECTYLTYGNLSCNAYP